jgi:hypothetical protein
VTLCAVDAVQLQRIAAGTRFVRFASAHRKTLARKMLCAQAKSNCCCCCCGRRCVCRFGLACLREALISRRQHRKQRKHSSNALHTHGAGREDADGDGGAVGGGDAAV